MASIMKRPRLEKVHAHSDMTLALQFVDKRHFLLNMRNDLDCYPGLAPLCDKAIFTKVTLGDSGWTAEWPDVDIQIGADTLLLDALAQSATDEDTRIFMRWRAQVGLSLHAAANALGVAPRTISHYSSGETKVPHTLALACLGWEQWQRHYAPSSS